MRRTTALPFRRMLAALMATSLLGGCGYSDYEGAVLPDRPRSPVPLALSAPARLPNPAAKPTPVIPAAYPGAQPPADGEATDAPATALSLKVHPSPAPLGSRENAAESVHSPVQDPDVQPPATVDVSSAYAVAPRRSADPEDRLASLSGPSDPTPQLVAIARQADEHIGRGFRLAERGATFTARAELLKSLRLSAAALDEQRNTAAHTRALNSGLRALSEAEEFLPAARTSDSSLHTVASIARLHRTPVLVDEADDINAGRAIEQYLTYAQEQLAAAGGDLQPAASALYALGKLDMAGASEFGSFESVRAAVFLQAALIVNPRHVLAANELGVLLARRGRLEEAKAALEHGLEITSLPAAWRNLSLVHQSLGRQDLAGHADLQWRQAAAAQPQQVSQAPGAPAVRWVDPNTFVRATQANFAAQR